ncbi:MAG: translation initiation factor IF-2 [Gammaproteobacteria bacterium]|nr:translation initiation factor IF-2 [Gammaproteobacteria bacterium]
MSQTIKVIAQRLNRPSSELLDLLQKNGTPKDSETDELTEAEATQLVAIALGASQSKKTGSGLKLNKLSKPNKTLGAGVLKKPMGLNRPSTPPLTLKPGKTVFRPGEAPAPRPRIGGAPMETRSDKDSERQELKDQVQKLREEQNIRDEIARKQAESQAAEAHAIEQARLATERKRESERQEKQRKENAFREEQDRRIAEERERERESSQKKEREPVTTKARPEREQVKPKPPTSIEEQVRAKFRRRDKKQEKFDTGDSRQRRSSRRNYGGGRQPLRLTRPTAGEQAGTFERPQFIQREVEIGQSILLGELAHEMSVKASDVIKKLMGMGVIATVNQALDQDTAFLIVEEFGHKAKIVAPETVEEKLQHAQDIEGEQMPRSPVVTVMGHVDHGKTSLLDHIRNTRVASGEAGGITQHIGAYHLQTEHGEITFLDTPGHAAFSAMRARGANATDIVVLVCAANDGVMPQTEEAVKHSLAAEVPIIIAINKMDLPEANPDLVKNGLAALGLTPEEWGGETQYVEVSAETGDGIDDLLEAISLQAELLELKAVEDSPARGVVIESKVERGRGPVASLLIQNGTLKQTDVVIAGQQFGKVRHMSDDQGKKLKSAGPSIPVEMLGLNGSPSAGDTFLVAANERLARQIADERQTEMQAKQHAQQRAAQLENITAALGEGQKRVLKIVLKADVRGSLEAITQACQELGNDEVSVQVLGSGVGGVNESDVNMALTYGALIFGFNVRADRSAKASMQRNKIEVKYYNIIYELLQDLEALLTDLLVPEQREEILGIAEVRDVFNSPRFGQIAGCMVTEGTLSRNKPIRVLRDSTVIYEGELESLRRFKDDVNEVRFGFECGIGVRNYNDVRNGDLIEVYQTLEIARSL